MTPEPLKIDIWSDIACPWCFIGKRRFEAGAAEAGVEVEIEYHSFELSPDTPVDFAGSEVEYLSGHRGIPASTAEQMIARVTGIAETVGLHYDYDALQHTNTVKAHQLLHYAKLRGRQLEMKERLLRAYFEEGRHVGRVEDLADLAAELGFDRADVVRSLEADEHLADVREDQQVAQDFGIQGVPFFVIDRKYGVSGAQEAATFAEVLRQVAAEKADAELAS
ncbi:DsbA family oxidoreductase [Protaetiibacter mangrovi]|uniref:DsbA family oxidoreductase n=1 Tax=Protaetiibacter mangrovi TaxID=2970926 RepID=A0ABT1ZJA6_9MICO|nr:DsbA family oxidoreductase [Protaetiibacter mangrovi]MCS0500768.1 DsbA family oxidoreductase [Protaetiibacter mangrovi]TPX04241.1 DsbA family oxidoreductase [Schumannella luteola]